MNVPRHINLNYVKDLRIDQEFKRREDGLWELDKDNTYMVFSILSMADNRFTRISFAAIPITIRPF